MNIDGLGPETVDLLYQEGLVKDISDLYSLTADQIVGLDRMGEKSALNIIKGIKESLNVPYERVLFAIGIRFVGETTAKLLAKAFPSIEKLMQATLDELMQVNEIGGRIAQSIITYFREPVNIDILERLKGSGLNFESAKEEEVNYSDKLEGKAIVISGVFSHHSRDEYKDIIEKNGGKNVGSISGKTSFILAGDNMGPSKLEKAQKLGVPIVSEDEFLNMIE